MSLRRWLLRLGLGAAAIAGLAVLGGWLLLRASLPILDGERALVGLSAPVTVERDALGSVSLRGSGMLDLTRALGYVHAQERFFEMDLSRRRAAGELAELFGAAALPLDRATRVHRFGHRAERTLSELPVDQQELLAAYADGINQGMAALGARPLPYQLLRTEPRPWQAADALLVGYAMYLMLQHNEVVGERKRIAIRRHLPAAASAFLLRAGTAWDAPLLGDPIEAPALPTADQFDARVLPVDSFDAVPPPSTGLGISAAGSSPSSVLDPGNHSEIGSNNFAVGGAISGHGAAILANDMHLGHGVPNIWFRLCLHDASAAIERVCGVSLPGLPGVVSGSNGHIAWGYTNSYGDWYDYVEVQVDPSDPDRYLSADGTQPFVDHDELIAVAGADAENLQVRETVWGPLIAADDEAPLALRWVAHLPGAMNLGVADLAAARSVSEALAVAERTGMPAQNLLVVDRHGDLAWTLIGPIPKRRFEGDPGLPIQAPAEEQIWDQWVTPEARPRLLNPDDHRLWTANNRVVSDQALQLVGDGGYDLGARAGQIRDRLRALRTATEMDLRAIQLDDQALFLEPWWHLLTATVERMPSTPRGDEIAAVAARWNRQAAVDSTAYRLVRAFRLQAHQRLLAPFAVAIRAEVADFEWPRIPQSEGAVWQLLRERPPHLLGSPWKDYDALLAEALLSAADDLGPAGELAEQTWGERNTSAIAHPLSRAVPALSWLLDMPVHQLPGDSNMPRVQGPAFGASERLVVAPGHEEHGLFHMPGGQSGHPLSPFYGSGHDDWANGQPTPFLPGESLHRLVLQPKS